MKHIIKISIELLKKIDINIEKIYIYVDKVKIRAMIISASTSGPVILTVYSRQAAAC